MDITSELKRRESNLDRVEALFKAHAGEWIPARDFEIPGGRQAWRSRVAECRTKCGMFIENRQERTATNQVMGSYYRWLPYGTPLGPSAETARREKHPAVQLPLKELR